MLWSWFCRQLTADSRKRLLLFFSLAPLLLCIPAVVFSQQTWTRTYGGSQYDEGKAVKQTSDGGYIIAGTTNSFGAGFQDVYLIKTDSLGNLIWSKTYGDSSSEGGNSLDITLDGGYIIAGYKGYLGNSLFYLIRADSLGDTLWTRTYGPATRGGAQCVRQTEDQGFIMVGSALDAIYFLKVDAQGDTLWSKIISVGIGASGNAVIQTSDKGYAITGSAADTHTGYVILVKTDSLGSVEWRNAYGWAWVSNIGYALQQTPDGGYIIAGMAHGGMVPGDAYLIKTDAQGNSPWSKTFGGSQDEYGYSVQQTSDGGYIVAGYTASFGTGGDVYLIKTSSSGDSLWARTYGGPESEVGYSVQQTADGGYIIVGNTTSFGAGYDDVYLIKTDGNGNVGVETQVRQLDGSTVRPLKTTPNPFTSFASVPGHSSDRFALYDISGRKVGVFKGDRIGLGLSAGVYFLKPQGLDSKPLRIVKLR